MEKALDGDLARLGAARDLPGRQRFDCVPQPQPQPQPPPPPVKSASELTPDQIKAILRRENELRLAPETQAEFRAAAAAKGPYGWPDVVEGLQRTVCREFGLSESVGFAAMRNADALLPGDDEVKQISLYRKYNRCKNGDLQEGDPPPDAPLIRVTDGVKSSVAAILSKSTLDQVFFVGSYT